VDIIPFLCGHYLRIGFARLHFIDDGSSDGTFEFLEDLAKKTNRVSVVREFGECFRQPELMTNAINELIGAGYRAIFPFDADEFWNIDAAGLGHIAELERPRTIGAIWVNFVQSRDGNYPRPFGLLKATHRAHPTPGLGMKEIVELKAPFVMLDTVTKVAFWSDSAVQIAYGQHHLISGPLDNEDSNVELFHLPFRWRSELTKRAMKEPRIAALRPHPEINWQSNFFSKIVREGTTDAVWRANSVDEHGCLDIYGTVRRIPRDTRLRRLLVLSTVYMFRRFGLLVF
jgi:glycosyltransferase involved in cell wall biosynthesis